ncbi:hypothetical protein Tco_1562262 [Tanacetum coccineum]
MTRKKRYLRKDDFRVELGVRVLEEEVVPKVDDVSLVDGVFDGAFGGDGEDDVVIGEVPPPNPYSIATHFRGVTGDPRDQRVCSQLIGKDLVSGLLVYEFPLSSKSEDQYAGNAIKKIRKDCFMMDDPNITMEEYIRLEEEKARIRGKVFNGETAKYGKIWYDEDIHDLRSVETKFPAIALNNEVSSETLCYEPTVSSLNDEIDFRVSFDDSDGEDYTLIF